jgi:glycosyltransferase involved in cell wall biosynthesis
MRIALVAGSYRPSMGGLERHIEELAKGLARRGADVEVLAQCAPRHPPRVPRSEGVAVRTFALSLGDGRSPVAPTLWRELRRTAESFDLVHVHTRDAPLALAVARSRPRRLVLTPHASVRHMLRWPYLRAMGAVMSSAALVICASRVEGESLAGKFPEAAARIRAIPVGVDTAAIQTAEALEVPGTVVLAVGRLEGHRRVDRAIAAMAGLDPTFTLVTIGTGPQMRRLARHAADLEVSSRVRLLGSLPDAQLYRWLRAARVVVALAEHHHSGMQVAKGLAAGSAVVASDIPVHREAAAHAGGVGVIFVSPEGSPLEVSDAISRASSAPLGSTAASSLPAWDDVVEETLDHYVALVHSGSRRDGVPGPSTRRDRPFQRGTAGVGLRE